MGFYLLLGGGGEGLVVACFVSCCILGVWVEHGAGAGFRPVGVCVLSVVIVNCHVLTFSGMHTRCGGFLGGGLGVWEGLCWELCVCVCGDVVSKVEGDGGLVMGWVAGLGVRERKGEFEG